MPNLTVIAGPNGAGKSICSADLLSTKAVQSFDYDFEFNARWKTYSYDPLVERGVREYVADLYLKLKQEAISKKNNFAFETNYHTNKVLDTVRNFKAEGFFTELIFIFLENTDLAKQRVKDRVACGGHSVEEETIEERFEKGIALLDDTFHQYDFVSLYLSKEKIIEAVCNIEPSAKRIVEFQTLPQVLQKKLPKLTQFMSGVA